MAVVRVRGRGQVTIPLSLRKDLHLDEEAMLTVVKAGVDTFAKEAHRELKKRGLRVDDVIDDLKGQRTRYNKDRYGT